MGVSRWYEIVTATQHYIVIRLKSKIPPLSIFLWFTQGAIFRSRQVLEIFIIVKLRLDFQITGPSIRRMLVHGDYVRTAHNCENILKQKQVYGLITSFFNVWPVRLIQLHNLSSLVEQLRL